MEQFSRRINIYIDSGNAQQSYDVLVAKQGKLNSELDELRNKHKKAMDDVANGNKKAQSTVESLTSKISKTEAAIDTVTQSMAKQQKKITGELAPSYRDLSDTVNKLGRELKRMSEQDDGFAAKKIQYNDAKAALDKYSFSLVSVRNNLAEMLKTAKGVAVGTLIGNSVQAVAASVMNQISGTIDAVAKRSDQEADIRKTTGLNTEQIKEVRSFFKELETRTGNDKLSQYASDAGKLGKESVADIKRFVDEANQISVALGEDLGQDAITQIGKVADIFDTSMLKIGSSINTVGQSSSASEAYITDFLFRMSGIGKTVNISAADLLGFGAVLDMNGQQVEAASTSLQKFFIDFVKNSGQFEQSAGMVKGSLSTLIDQKGVNAAFLEFLKNLKASTSSSDDFLKKLDEIGIDGSRGASTFLTLANNISEVEKQQKIATKSFDEGTSITAEYAIRNETLAAQIERLKKAWAGLFSSDEATSVVAGLVTVGTKAIDVFKAIPKFIKENSNLIIVLATSYALYNRALLANFIQTTANSIAFRVQYGWLVLTELWTKASAVATNLYSFAQGVLTGRITMAVAIQRIQNALSIASGNVFTIIATAVTLAAGAIALYYNNVNKGYQIQKMMNDISTDASKRTVEEKTNLESLVAIAKDEHIAKEKRLDAMNQINAISPEYLGNLTLENINTAEGTKLLSEYIVMLDKRSTAEAIQSKMVELKTKLIEVENSSYQDNIKWYNYLTAALMATSNARSFDISLMLSGMNNKNKETGAIYEQIEALKKLTTEKVKSGEISVNDLNSGASTTIGGSNTNKQAGTKDKKIDTSALEKFYADIAKLEAESEKLKLSANEKEIADAQDKYDELQRRRKDFETKGLIGTKESLAQEKRIRELMAEEFAKIGEKQYAKRSEDEYAASLKASERYFAEQKLAATKSYAEGVISQEQYQAKLDAITLTHSHVKVQIAQDYSETVKQAAEDVLGFQQQAYQQDIEAYIKAENEKKRFKKSQHDDVMSQDNADIINAETKVAFKQVRDAKLKALKDEAAYELSLTETTEAKKNEIIAKYNADRASILQEYSQKVADGIKQYGGAIIEMTSAFGTILSNIENAQLNREKTKNQAALTSYKKQLDQKLISQDQYNALVDAANHRMDQKERELKRKQFNRDKAIKLATAVINVAAGVAETIGETGVGAIVLGAIVAALGAVQIGVIASEQPSFETGGVIKGSRHAEGGIALVDSKSGRKVGEMEDGEPYMILSRETMANNGLLINDLLSASMYGGGRKVNPKYYRPNNINATRAFENITYSSGGIRVDGNTKAGSISDTMIGAELEKNAGGQPTMKSLRLMEEQNALLKSILEKKEGGISLTDLAEKQKMYNYLNKQQQL